MKDKSGREVEKNTCRCHCTNQFTLPGVRHKVGCKDKVHCGRVEQGCGFKRGESW